MLPFVRLSPSRFILLLLTFSLTLTGCKKEEKKPEFAQIPSVTLPTLEGKPYTFSAKDNQVSLVVFWATWCHPCLMEIPDLMSLHARYANRGFRVIAINIDDPEGKKIAAIDERYNINYPLLLDDGTTEEKFGGLQALPTSFLIGRNGRIKRIIEGLYPAKVIETAVLNELQDE